MYKFYCPKSRSKKALEKITVKELCEKAKINKSTFYSHYHDVYDLSEQLETEIVNSIIEQMNHPEYVIQKPELFNQELHEGYMAKNTLIDILFSGTRSNILIHKIGILWAKINSTFHCAKSGYKLYAIQRNAKASFCVIDQDTIVPEEYTTYFRSVIVFGRIQVEEDLQEKWESIKKLAIIYAPEDTAESDIPKSEAS